LCIEKLAAGRTWDGFVQSDVFIKTAIDKGAAIKFLDNKWLTTETICVALDKGGKDTASMLAAINEIIGAAKADGTLADLSKKNLSGVDATVKQ
jgi:ABC-type amino acid transport substrate-binding protein